MPFRIDLDNGQAHCHSLVPFEAAAHEGRPLIPPVYFTNPLQLFAILVVAAAALPLAAQRQGPAYPDTRRVDHIDVYHGTEVADPYRWLEQDVRESSEVEEWVAAENKVDVRLP